MFLLALASAKDVQPRPKDSHAEKRAPKDEGTWRAPGSENDTQGLDLPDHVIKSLLMHCIAAALDVEKAWAELRSIQSTNGRTSRLRKQSGILGTTTYYAKKGFTLLFMNSPKHEEAMNTATGKKKLRKPLSNAVRLLEGAAHAKNPDAMYMLAEMNFHGNFSYPRNFREAFRWYHELAALTGNSSAQHIVGFMYATGIGDAVERDQGKALLFYTFAARAGNIRSELAVAYRHHAGIGTPRNCDESVKYYKKVADRAIDYARSGPPGGQSIMRHAYRIADEEGGVYGRGASFTSSGINAQDSSPSSDQNADFDDVMEYLDFMSRKGNANAMFSLGRLHYEGSRTMKRNFKVAKTYFRKVARKYWTKDGKERREPSVEGKIASKAVAYLGRLYLRGEGVEQNFNEALRYFKLGVSLADEFCQYEIGLMYLHGLGVPKSAVTASNYFKQAAQQEWPAAQVNLGKLFLDQGDLPTAIQYFRSAERHHHIEALYHLAEVNNYGVGRGRDCTHAVGYYKAVAEKAEVLHSSFIEANAAYDDGDKETALIGYMMAAEQGYEQGQANVAFILDEHKSIMSFNSLMPLAKSQTSLFKNDYLALLYWTRSARQRNIDSMVKTGDYYLSGYGVPKDVEKAASCYEAAQDMQHSAQAAWNLAWMHENGIGIDQDYHLAWRYYMLALEISPEAYLPVRLSLSQLYLRDWWNRLTGGEINSIQPEPGE